MVSYFLVVFFTTLFLGVPIVKSFVPAERNMDLLFLVLCNCVFLISTTAFLFYYEHFVFAFFSSFFLCGYAILLFLELKKENKDALLFSLPYFSFTFSLLFLLGIQVIF